MATLLESVSVFQDVFNFFLPFLLVFVTLYAVLQKSKYLSDDPNINGLISFAIAFIFALSGGGQFLMALLPYLTVMFIVTFVVFLLFMFFGVKAEEVMKVKIVPIAFVLISILFIFYVIGNLYSSAFLGQGAVSSSGNVTTGQLPGYETCNFEVLTGPAAMACLLGNPKILGAIVLFGLMIAATFFILYVPKP